MLNELIEERDLQPTPGQEKPLLIALLMLYKLFLT